MRFRLAVLVEPLMFDSVAAQGIFKALGQGLKGLKGGKGDKSPVKPSVKPAKGMKFSFVPPSSPLGLLLSS